MLRSLVLTAALLTLYGCKVAVIVVDGGEVQSTASGICSAGFVCIHEVANTNYLESFTAVPAPGWQFVKWKFGDDFFCKGSTNPTCVVDNTPLAGLPAVEAIVASDKTYYIMPVFEALPPVTDTVVSNGLEWAQVPLFQDLSWYEIDAVCPSASGGVCTSDGLNGWDMTGWTWAGLGEIYALFNAYGASPLMGPGIDSQFTTCEPGNWVGQFFSDGWTPSGIGGFGGNDEFMNGWLRTIATQFEERAFSSSMENSVPGTTDCDLVPPQAGTSYTDMNLSGPTLGAWFYRVP